MEGESRPTLQREGPIVAKDRDAGRYQEGTTRPAQLSYNEIRCAINLQKPIQRVSIFRDAPKRTRSTKN